MLVTLDANMSETSFCQSLLVDVIIIPEEKTIHRVWGCVVYLQLTSCNRRIWSPGFNYEYALSGTAAAVIVCISYQTKKKNKKKVTSAPIPDSNHDQGNQSMSNGHSVMETFWKVEWHFVCVVNCCRDSSASTHPFSLFCGMIVRAINQWLDPYYLIWYWQYNRLVLRLHISQRGF